MAGDAIGEGDNVPITVTASEAKNRLGSLIKWVQSNRDDVIVESHGQPKAVIIPYSEYETVVSHRETSRREDALRRLEQVRQSVQARTQDLTEEEASALADRFVREVVEDMVIEGKVRYQG